MFVGPISQGPIFDPSDSVFAKSWRTMLPPTLMSNMFVAATKHDALPEFMDFSHCLTVWAWSILVVYKKQWGAVSVAKPLDRSETLVHFAWMLGL